MWNSAVYALGWTRALLITRIRCRQRLESLAFTETFLSGYICWCPGDDGSFLFCCRWVCFCVSARFNSLSILLGLRVLFLWFSCCGYGYVFLLICMVLVKLLLVLLLFVILMIFLLLCFYVGLFFSFFLSFSLVLSFLFFFYFNLRWFFSTYCISSLDNLSFFVSVCSSYNIFSYFFSLLSPAFYFLFIWFICVPDYPCPFLLILLYLC